MRRLLLAGVLLVLGTGSALAAPLPAVSPSSIAGANPSVSPALVSTPTTAPTPWPMALTPADVWASTPSFAPLPTPLPTPPPIPTVADAQAWALDQLGPQGYACLDLIIRGESRWNPYAWNTKGSGAYGLGQAKPASKMAPYGADYMTNPITQTRWAIAYGQRKYGSVCGAAQFWAKHGWW